MKLSDWLFLSALVLLIMALGLFSRTSLYEKKIEICSPGKLLAKSRPAPLLCGQRMKLAEASPHDFAMVDGISLKTARLMRQFIKEHPQAVLADLLAIKGVGPKTVFKLEAYFW